MPSEIEMASEAILKESNNNASEHEIEINLEPEILIESSSFSLLKNDNMPSTNIENKETLKNDMSSEIKTCNVSNEQPKVEQKVKLKTDVEGEPSMILHVSNLIRPFSLQNFKLWLLKSCSNMIENSFWIDSIKSQCIIYFSDIESSKMASDFLSQNTWPSISEKLLKVKFLTSELAEDIKNGLNVEKKVVEVLEKVAEKNNINEPNTKAFKALEDFFNKTVATPHIFWMKYVSAKYSKDDISSTSSHEKKEKNESSNEKKSKECRRYEKESKYDKRKINHGYGTYLSERERVKRERVSPRSHRSIEHTSLNKAHNDSEKRSTRRSFSRERYKSSRDYSTTEEKDYHSRDKTRKISNRGNDNFRRHDDAHRRSRSRSTSRGKRSRVSRHNSLRRSASKDRGSNLKHLDPYKTASKSSKHSHIKSQDSIKTSKNISPPPTHRNFGKLKSDKTLDHKKSPNFLKNLDSNNSHLSKPKGTISFAEDDNNLAASNILSKVSNKKSKTGFDVKNKFDPNNSPPKVSKLEPPIINQSCLSRPSSKDRSCHHQSSPSLSPKSSDSFNSLNSSPTHKRKGKPHHRTRVSPQRKYRSERDYRK